MPKINFENKDVQAKFKDFCKLGGDLKNLDTQKERDELSVFLQENKDNLSDHDYNILDGFVKQAQVEKPAQHEKSTTTPLVDSDTNNNVVGDGNASAGTTVFNGDINLNVQDSNIGVIQIGGANTNYDKREENPPVASPTPPPSVGGTGGTKSKDAATPAKGAGSTKPKDSGRSTAKEVDSKEKFYGGDFDLVIFYHEDLEEVKANILKGLQDKKRTDLWPKIEKETNLEKINDVLIPIKIKVQK